MVVVVLVQQPHLERLAQLILAVVVAVLVEQQLTQVLMVVQE
jgi:hypothetical protein